MDYYFAQEEWRAKRLQKALRIASAILGTSLAQLDVLIREISDHNGNLHILWNHGHTPQQELAFQTAWTECGEARVTHATFGGSAK